MILQSKFGHYILSQTLDIALCKLGGWSDYYVPPADLSGQGHKNIASFQENACVAFQT